MKNIEELKGELDAEYRTCSGEELLSLTSDGWELVSSFDEDQVENLFRDEKTDPPQQYSPYGPPSNVYNNNNEPPCPAGHDRLRSSGIARKRRFLLKHSADTVVQQLRRELSVSNDSLFQTGAEVGKLKLEIEKANKKAAGLEDELRQKKDAYTMLCEDLSSKREAARNMERDLGKLREHFGKKAVDEALGKKP